MDNRNTTEQKRICIALLAHVDAGKTTLSESLLHATGEIRSLGKVDDQNTHLDTDTLEKQRGITIFSREAKLSYEGMDVMLVDTPGHVDFAAEMERSLQILDYAVLLISGSEGVQSHTKTLWKLLTYHKIPTFIFVNKMDLANKVNANSKEEILAELQSQLDSGCFEIADAVGAELTGAAGGTAANPAAITGTSNIALDFDTLATTSEEALEEYLESGEISDETLAEAVANRSFFPVIFGAAAHEKGTAELLEALKRFTNSPKRYESFSGKVYRIGRDNSGVRLTFMKVTGGSVKVREEVTYRNKDGEEITQKVNQIRMYSGDAFTPLQEAVAGDLVAVTGLDETFPGLGIGEEDDAELPVLEPVLSYQVLMPKEVPANTILEVLRRLEEADPQLMVDWDERHKEIHVHLMGPVQLEILQAKVKEMCDVVITFGPARVMYKETIAAPVIGIGHFEPLRHYAEVQLMIEPLERGSGMQFEADCPVELLESNWQSQVLHHLKEREHRGVLTGSFITDMKVTLIAGRASVKHTEGGDFRQATFRALRQGLMKAENILLEPYYHFVLEVPAGVIGRAMTDLDGMHAKMEAPQIEGDLGVIEGSVAVSQIGDYVRQVNSYSGGLGSLNLTNAGYDTCIHPEEVIEAAGYDPEMDNRNPSGSVFCAQGAGYVVPWYEVDDYKHVETPVDGQIQDAYDDEHLEKIAKAKAEAYQRSLGSRAGEGTYAFESELKDIFEKTFGPVKTRLANEGLTNVRDYDQIKAAREAYEAAHPNIEAKRKAKEAAKKSYFLVDGYNVIHAWPELNDLFQTNMDAARGKLLDILSNYQGYIGDTMIVVFDAYKVKGSTGSVSKYGNLHVVYTKEAETADAYIERATHDLGKDHRVTVATSDGLVQMIVIGDGARRMSSRELQEEVARVNKEGLENYTRGNN